MKILPDIRSPPNYQVISKVSYISRSLLNPIIFYLKALIGLFKYMHGQVS